MAWMFSFPLPQVHMVKPNVQADGVRSWNLQSMIRAERLTLIDEINALRKEPRDSPLPLLQWQPESAVCKLKGAFTKTLVSRS